MRCPRLTSFTPQRKLQRAKLYNNLQWSRERTYSSVGGRTLCSHPSVHLSQRTCGKYPGHLSGRSVSLKPREINGLVLMRVCILHRHCAHLGLPACTRSVPSVGHVDGVAVTIRTASIPAQSVHPSHAIRPKPLTPAHPFHFPPPSLNPTPASVHQLIRRVGPPLGCIGETRIRNRAKPYVRARN